MRRFVRKKYCALIALMLLYIKLPLSPAHQWKFPARLIVGLHGQKNHICCLPEYLNNSTMFAVVDTGKYDVISEFRNVSGSGAVKIWKDN